MRVVLPGREKLTLSLKPAKGGVARGVSCTVSPSHKRGESLVGPGAAPRLGLQNLLRGRSLLKAFICEMGGSTAVVPASSSLVLLARTLVYFFSATSYGKSKRTFDQPNRRPETFAKSCLRRLPGRRSQQSVCVTEGDLTERAP